MLNTRRMFRGLAALFAALIIITATDMTVMAGSRDYLDTLNVGATTVMNPSTSLYASRDEDAGTQDALEKREEQIEASDNEKAPTDLVMANVETTMNVRAEASDDSEKVGVLYKDCGGRIVERKEGWTKIKSGNLVGWAKDEYLLFDEEAEALAQDVGNVIVTIETDALRVRREPSADAEVFALIAQDDALEVVEVVNNEWISVAYDEETAFVSSEFVNMDFHIDAGETVDAIRTREKAEAEALKAKQEAEAKAKLTANQGAVSADADDTRLLAALIYCEAGNQGYDGQLAVGATVMNRVRSGAYPGSINGVIYASGQFPPALNGKVARVYNGNIPESCLQAARDALTGASNIGGATHFKRAGTRDGIVIRDHVFW